MTQGELLSAFAPIDTFIQICQDRYERIDEYLTNDYIDKMMPFVTKAQEAAEKLSSFALEHSNSKDDNKRNLSKLIRNKFISLQGSLLYETLLGRERATIAWLNNSIKSVNSLIENTIEFSDALEEIPSNNDSQIEKLPKEISMLKQQNDNRKGEEERERLEFLEDWQKMSAREFAIFFSQALGVSFNPELINQNQLAQLAAKWTKSQPDTIRSKIGNLFKEETDVNNGKLDNYSRKTQEEAWNVYFFIIKIAKYYSTITPQMHTMLDNIEQIYSLNIGEEKKKSLFEKISKDRKSV